MGLPGRVLASKEPHWIMDVTQDANFPRAKAAVNIGVKGAFDAEDGTRDWGRAVRARGSDANGGTTVEIKVRACKGGQCVTSTQREHLEREDD